jgi:stearoyl-CoA desaturase (Delta-9 desaturase)
LYRFQTSPQHNYHHVFPWDYRAAELGSYRFNYTTFLIEFFAKIGWAYDLKKPAEELVTSMILNHGDGTHFGLH